MLKISGVANGTRFENADGVSAVLPDDRLNVLKVNNATELIPLRGEVGFSELGMFCGIARSVGVVAFKNPDFPERSGAFVLTNDGKLTPGLLHAPSEWDGRFSLS